jgi:tRNA dimethylallyltransferase
MLAAGLLDEVRALHARTDVGSDAPALRVVGYRQLCQHLAGTCDLDTAIERAVAATRQLAKRQHTWLRAEPDCDWLDSLRADTPARVAQRLRAAQFHW